MKTGRIVGVALSLVWAGCASAAGEDGAASEKRPMAAILDAPGDEVTPFDGFGGPTGVGGAPVGDAVIPNIDVADGIGSNCSQSLPAARTLPCEVPEAGAIFYVSPSGNDANGGSSPGTAWKTLFHAVRAAAENSTIRVAEGVYESAVVYVGRAVVVKGGFDASFQSWDPDQHRSYFAGTLALAHDQAIWGGFRMIRRTAETTAPTDVTARASNLDPNARSTRERAHEISGGTLLRNSIEVSYQATLDKSALSALAISTPEGHRSRLYCNDLYVRGQGISTAPSFSVRGVAYESFAGEARIASNRVCVDRSEGILVAEAFGGTAASTKGAPARITMTNNVIEAHGANAASGIRLAGGLRNVDTIMTNNTIFSEVDGITSEPTLDAKLTWHLTNNVVFSSRGRRGIHVGPKGSSSAVIDESSGNLVFGFASNAMSPSPLLTHDDDTTGRWTIADVMGDAFAPRGPALSGGVNVFGNPAYGAVRTDMRSHTRPTDGTWTRGAIQ